MNDSIGDQPQPRNNDPFSMAASGSITRQTSMLHSSSTGASFWKPRHDADAVAAQDQTVSFAAQVRAIAASLPEEGAYARIRRLMLQAADESIAPTLLAICNDVSPAENSGERGSLWGRTVQAVALQHTPPASLTACGEGDAVSLGALPVLQSIARTAHGTETIERFLLALLSDLPGDRSRDALLLFLPGPVAAADGSWESAARLLRRAQMIFWLTASAPVATGLAPSNWSNRPVDLLAVDLQSVFRGVLAPAGNAPVPGQTDLPLNLPAEESIGPTPQLVMRDVQEKAALLFQDSRLLQMQAALLHLNSSPQEHDRRLRLSVRRIQTAMEELTRCLTKLANTVDMGFREARTDNGRRRGCREIDKNILPVWEARQDGPSDWLIASGENSPQSDSFLPEPALLTLQSLRSAYTELVKERRTQEREEARIQEERRFLERRLEELRQTQISAEDDLALQLLSGLLGEAVSDPAQAETATLEEQLCQCLADEGQISSSVESLAQRSEELAGEARQLAASVVEHLRSICIERGDAAGRRHAGLRKTRWELQANAGAIAAAASMARACQTLEETVRGFGEAVPFTGCIQVLRACRHACDSLRHLRDAGSAPMLRLYRRILSIELQAVAETVTDCTGVLQALDMALSRVPVEELWRALSLFAAQQNSPLAHFARHLCGWLCEQEPDGAEAAGYALAHLQPNENILSEIGDFLEHHADGRESELFNALLATAPRHMREVLRRAPRHSPAYRQALLMVGAEILNVFATPLE